MLHFPAGCVAQTPSSDTAGGTAHGLAGETEGNWEQDEERVFTRNVGILPIFGPAVISTKGLEWDVHGWRAEMGGDVSTSNHLVSEDVGIEVSVDREEDGYVEGGKGVLFTIETSIGPER